MSKTLEIKVMSHTRRSVYNKVFNQIQEREFNAYTLLYVVKDKAIHYPFTEVDISFSETDISMEKIWKLFLQRWGINMENEMLRITFIY